MGKVDYHVQQQLKAFHLDNYLHKIDYIAHSEVIVEQQKSHVLLLVVNDAPNAKGILTGKIFEYLAAQRPIIAIAPKDGDLAEVLQKTETGVVFEGNTNQVAALKSHILELFQNRHLPYTANQNFLQFSRRNLTKELAEVVKGVVG